ncbi:MAG TPA: hypothetical protein VHX12_12990 [Acidisoma sp.]|jgi:hypothetical protein|nr:hypothetical protein [Acidisoma sp.]
MCEGGKTAGTGERDALLEAAEKWVEALEVLVAAQQRSGETEMEQEDLDIAGSQLVMAVARWRTARGSG